KGKQPLPPLRELYVAAGRPTALPDPDTNKPLAPKALGGPAIATKERADAPAHAIQDGAGPRAAFSDWLCAPGNPYFARSFVNRAWGHYFGIGIVEPVDDFSLANPASNPALLDAVAHDFVEHGFDIRHVERTILRSGTYQLSAVPNGTNRLDRTNSP